MLHIVSHRLERLRGSKRWIDRTYYIKLLYIRSECYRQRATIRSLLRSKRIFAKSNRYKPVTTSNHSEGE